MSHFHKARITEIRKETAECVSVAIKPENPNEDFHFQAGQYLNFCFELNQEELHRSYSLCSAPHEHELRVAVKQIPDGRVSTHFNENLSVGDEVLVMKPEGNFILPPIHEPKHFVFFAAGSGITPIISLIKTCLHSSLNHKLTLFYGNRSQNSIIFKEELELLANQHAEFRVFHILSDASLDVPLFSGRINFGKTTELLYNFCSDTEPKEYFICGPSGMMSSIQNALLDAEIPKENIHLEYFAAPSSDDAPTEPKEDSDEQFEGNSRIKVVLDDEEIEFELNAKGTSILNAVLDEGEDAPYSCKGGVCTTCKAKLLKGKVRMDSNFALTDSEIKAGYILTCQSHPNSAEVEISYDE